MPATQQPCPACGAPLKLRLGQYECPRCGYPDVDRQRSTRARGKRGPQAPRSEIGITEDIALKLAKDAGTLSSFADPHIPGVDYYSRFLRQKRMFLRIFGIAQTVCGFFVSAWNSVSSDPPSNAWSNVLGILLKIVISAVLLYVPLIPVKRVAIVLLGAAVCAAGYYIFLFSDGSHPMAVLTLTVDALLAIWLAALLYKDMYWLRQPESHAIHSDPYLELPEE